MHRVSEAFGIEYILWPFCSLIRLIPDRQVLARVSRYCVTCTLENDLKGFRYDLKRTQVFDTLLWKQPTWHGPE